MKSRSRLVKPAVLALLLTLGATCFSLLGQIPTPQPSKESPGRGSQDLNPRYASTNCLISSDHLYQIPGPNPAIVRGERGAWDESVIESCDSLKNFGTYYWYYHGTPKDSSRWPRLGYRIGVATSRGPLGPWTKYKGNPILDLGPKGSWDDSSVACAFVLKEGVNHYYMWYSGIGNEAPYKKWSIGLATATSPLGPWKKYSGNPIIKKFGYMGGVVRHNQEYFLYTEYPIGSTAPDYGPISLATANKPEGPWTVWQGNPVLKAGDWGAWDDAGFSESKVVFWNGMFHIFYGGAKTYQPRMLTRESIGYAYSFDGYHFIKYLRNPVARREAVPNAASFSEVHCLFEPPFIYLYHTLRYVSYPSPQFPRVEDLGIQVLAMQRRFRLAMPALTVKSLPPGAWTSLTDSTTLNLENVSKVGLTAQCDYDQHARAGIQIHIRGSSNGIDYDTTDLYSFDNDFRPGNYGRRTVNVDTNSKFIKILVQNLDRSHPVSNVAVAATLVGQ